MIRGRKFYGNQYITLGDWVFEYEWEKALSEYVTESTSSKYKESITGMAMGRNRKLIILSLMKKDPYKLSHEKLWANAIRFTRNKVLAPRIPKTLETIVMFGEHYDPPTKESAESNLEIIANTEKERRYEHIDQYLLLGGGILWKLKTRLHMDYPTMKS